jgi:lysophospholipase L1-like esterase
MPKLMWIVDNGVAQYAQLTDGASSLSLATSLNQYISHTLEVYLFGANELQNRWGSSGVSPTNVLRVKDITIDSGGSAAVYPLIRPKTMLFFGDSIVEGVRAAGTTTEPGDHGKSAPWFLGPALNAEYGVIGYGGTGWQSTGSGNMPPLPTAWDKHSYGRARTFSNVDYLFVMLGYNAATAQSDVQNWLPLARAAVGPSTWIFIVMAPSNRYSSVQKAAVDAYNTANPADTRTVWLSYADRVDTSIFDVTSWTANYATTDGVHPLEWANGMIANFIAIKAQEAMGGSGGSGSPRFSSKFNRTFR